LYQAVNNVMNAGAIVELTPGRYPLDPSQIKGGRLELQPGMTLRGYVGDASQVIIDASPLPVSAYNPSGTSPTTGAVRLGMGVQTVEWLTVSGSQGVAAIETDLTSILPPSVTLSHLVVNASRRGIDIRNTGSGRAGRVLIVSVRDTKAAGSTGAVGQGIRLLNADNANGAVIVATLERNTFSGNRIGGFAGNNGTIGSVISISSTDDVFSDGGVGFGAVGGVASTSSSTVSVAMVRPTFRNNRGPLPAGFGVNAGLSVEGASTSATTQVANSNTASVSLTSPTFADNWTTRYACASGTALPAADVRAWGARSTTTSRAGSFNTGSVSIVGGTPNLLTCGIASEPTEAFPTNFVSLAVSP
jgi:hypothetical protein